MVDFLTDTHLAYPLLASVAVLIGAAFGKARYGAVFAVAFYYGREVAHAGGRWRDNPSWWGFDPTRWGLDNHLDFWPVLVWLALLVVAIERLKAHAAAKRDAANNG